MSPLLFSLLVTNDHRGLYFDQSVLTEHFRDRMTERLLQTAEELRRIDDALAARSPATLQPSPEKFVAATGWYR